jgi:hypothetical protein
MTNPSGYGPMKCISHMCCNVPVFRARGLMSTRTVSCAVTLFQRCSRDNNISLFFFFFFFTSWYTKLCLFRLHLFHLFRDFFCLAILSIVKYFCVLLSVILPNQLCLCSFILFCTHCIEEVGLAVIISICIREVLGSNLGHTPAILTGIYCIPLSNSMKTPG